MIARPRGALRPVLVVLFVAAALAATVAARTRAGTQGPHPRVGATLPPERRYPAQRWPMFEVSTGARRFRAVTFDGHVHTAYSHDARHPVRDVLALAERVGLDAVMITDHGTSLAVRDVENYQGTTTPIVGAEIGGRYGHALTWAFVDAPRMRSEPIDDMPALGRAVHAQDGVLVLAHPGWFIAPNWVNPRFYMQYDSVRRGGIAESIDGIELWNATYAAPTDSLMEEWLSLLDRSVYVPITAGTDFHRFGQVELGSPRNVVLCELDPSGRPLESKRDCLLRRAPQGRSYLTDGPIVDLQVDGRTFGELVQVDAGATVQIFVRVAAWQGGRLRVRIGHVDVRTFELPAGRERHFRIPLRVPSDTYVFVEVERPVREPGKPRISLISNPVRVDVRPFVADWRGPPAQTAPRIPMEFTRAGRGRQGRSAP